MSVPVPLAYASDGVLERPRHARPDDGGARTLTEIRSDPESGIPYARLPWSDIGVSLLADPQYRETLAVTHFFLVTEALTPQSAADRIEQLGRAIGEIFTGL